MACSGFTCNVTRDFQFNPALYFDQLVGRPEGERLPASLAMALLCLQRGARILRVHDVRETRDVVRIWEALESA